MAKGGGGSKRAEILLNFNTDYARRQLRELDGDVSKLQKAAGGGPGGKGGAAEKEKPGFLSGVGQTALGFATGTAMSYATQGITDALPGAFAGAMDKVVELIKRGLEALGVDVNAVNAWQLAKEMVGEQEGKRRAAGLEPMTDQRMYDIMFAIKTILERQEAGQRAAQTIYEQRYVVPPTPASELGLGR